MIPRYVPQEVFHRYSVVFPSMQVSYPAGGMWVRYERQSLQKKIFDFTGDDGDYRWCFRDDVLNWLHREIDWYLVHLQDRWKDVWVDQRGERSYIDAVFAIGFANPVDHMAFVLRYGHEIKET